MGIGNFLEVGPLDVNLKPRNSTWLQKADLIFVVSLLLQTPHAHLRLLSPSLFCCIPTESYV